MTRRRIILFSSFIVSFGCLAFLLSWHKEPSYQGKTLEQWLLTVDLPLYYNGPVIMSRDKHTLENCKAAVTAMGTNAIPSLLGLLQAQDSPLQIKLNSFLDWQPFDAVHLRTANVKHVMAQEGFAMLGTNAQPALPVLMRMLEQCKYDTSGVRGESVHNIVEVMRLIGPIKRPCIELLEELLKSSDFGLRRSSAFMLYKISPEEAGKAGVYEMFPEFRNARTNTVSSNVEH